MSHKGMTADPGKFQTTFPPNITPLSDNILNCIIVFPFFVLHIFPNQVLCIVSSHYFRWSTPKISIWDSHMEQVDGTQTLPRLHG